MYRADSNGFQGCGAQPISVGICQAGRPVAQVAAVYSQTLYDVSAAELFLKACIILRETCFERTPIRGDSNHCGSGACSVSKSMGLTTHIHYLFITYSV